jgi:thioredoxin-dependent peroxiredoxin
MKQLREFAQRKSDFDAQDARVVGVSVDDLEHTRKVWNEVAKHDAIILSDPGAKVIREYGLLHPKGYKGEDIALRATLIVDKNGREVFRQVSSSVPDVRHADQILAELKKIP